MPVPPNSIAQSAWRILKTRLSLTPAFISFIIRRGGGGGGGGGGDKEQPHGIKIVVTGLTIPYSKRGTPVA